MEWKASMDNWVLALILKPFVALGLLLLVYFVVRLVWRLMPDNKWRRTLFSPLPGHRKRGGD